mmetsp:Transcript_68886/g.213817  ORF Transcript_68886/g.213817 Transcript_68886/m.213817 type:complete len:223 (-) Transcript_68886:568-1236(-)
MLLFDASAHFRQLASKSQLKELVAQAHEILFATHCEDFIVFENPSFYSFLKLRLQSLRGTPCLNEPMLLFLMLENELLAFQCVLSSEGFPLFLYVVVFGGTACFKVLPVNTIVEGPRFVAVVFQPLPFPVTFRFELGHHLVCRGYGFVFFVQVSLRPIGTASCSHFLLPIRKNASKTRVDFFQNRVRVYVHLWLVQLRKTPRDCFEQCCLPIEAASMMYSFV